MFVTVTYSIIMLGEQEKPIKQTDTPEARPALRSAEHSGKLYEVEEIDGAFEVTMPGLIDEKRGVFVGTRTERYQTRQEAEQGTAEAELSGRRLLEMASLKKSLGKHIFRFDQTPDGKFKVTLPGLKDLERGHYVGTVSEDFDTWEEARDYLLENWKNEENLVKKPLLEIETAPGEKVIFSALDAFNPMVVPSQEPRPIPVSVRGHVLRKDRLEGKDSSAKTYKKTIEKKGWDKDLFRFVSDYLGGKGAALAKSLKIENLDALTPRQAIDLATQIVIDLTKYKWSDTKSGSDILGEKVKPSQADQSTTQELLAQGLINKDKKDWDGNGVCRNFASMVKAVFEAIKANQTKFSRLNDTYCLYDDGNDEFRPEREDTNKFNMAKVGHAWNSFVTVGKEGANATITDATWARRDLDTGEISGLDHTLVRMEPVVHAVGQSIKDGAPNKLAQAERLLSYYNLKITALDSEPADVLPLSKLNEAQKRYYKNLALKEFGKKYDLGGRSDDELATIGLKFVAAIEKAKNDEREQQFFAGRAVGLVRRLGLPGKLPDRLAEVINGEYPKIGNKADRTEIETIFGIAKKDTRIKFIPIIRAYLKDRPLTEYRAQEVTFTDDNLQRLAYEVLRVRPEFSKFIKESPTFRSRLRMAVPEALPDFSPTTMPEDAEELKNLIAQSRGLERFKIMLSGKLTDESIGRLIQAARGNLSKMNPDRYTQVAGYLNDYELLKNYDELARQLSQKVT